MSIHKKLYLLNLVLGGTAIITWIIVLILHLNVYWPWLFNIAQFTALFFQWYYLKKDKKKLKNEKI